jgi:predicted transcriptional regulator
MQFKIDPETEQKLVQIAKETERTKSSMLRWLINQEYERQFKSKKSTHSQPALTQAD